MLGPSAITLASARIAALLLQAMCLLILAHALGPRDFGVFSLVLLVQSLIAVVSNLGMSVASQYSVGRGEIDLERVAAASLVATAVGSVVLVPPAGFVLSSLYQLVLQGLPFNLFIVAMLAGPIRLAYEALHGNFIGTGDVRGQTLIVAVGPGLLLLLLIFAAITIGVSLSVAVLAWLSSQVAILALALLEYQRHGRLLAPSQVVADSGLWTRLLRIGLSAYVAYVVYWATMRLDRFALNVAGGAEAVGIFAVAGWVAESFMLLPTAIGAVLFPRLAAEAPDSPSSYTAAATRATIGATAALGLLTFIAFWFASVALESDILRIATPVLAAVLPGYILFSVFGIFSSYWAAHGRVLTPAVYFAATAVGKVGVTLALYERVGIVGVAAAMSVVSATSALIAAAAVARRLGVSIAAILIPGLDDARRVASSSMLIVSRLRALPSRES